MIGSLVCILVQLGSSETPPVPDFAFDGIRSVLHDQDDSGRRFAVGNSYKLIVDADGARYYPRFGARAERNFPLHFAFPDAVLSTHRIDDRIVIERVGFTEIYDLGLDVVEQSFLIEKRGSDGDLDFRIPLATELESLASEGAGLRFGRADLGEVHYGDATIVDAAGNRVHAKSQRDSDAIHIVVPDAFLDRAAFPIVIDPLIETIGVDVGTDDMKNPDVAYAPTNNVFCVVYERVFSATDSDLLQRRYEFDGDFLEEVLLAGDTSSETDPAIAHATGNFLTVFRDIGFFGVRIKARNRIASNTTVGTMFDVSNAIDDEEGVPDIGATSAGTAFPFLITHTVHSTVFPPHDHYVVMRTYSPSGALGTESTVSEIFDGFTNPKVSQQVRFGGAYLVAFEAEDNPLTGPPERDIRGILIDPITGAKIGSVFDVCDTPDFADSAPDVGGDGVDHLVAWSTKPESGDADLLARRYRFEGTSQALGGVFSLTDLDHTGTDSLEQLDPVVGFDGARFVVVYRETGTGSSNFDIVASTYFATGTSPFSGTQLALEKRTSLAKTSQIEFDPAITSCGSDQVGLHFSAWTMQFHGTDRDVRAALFSSLGSGSDAVTIQTGCGSPEPGIFTSTQAVIGAGYQIIVNATNPLLLVGFPTNLPLCPGQGGCVLGVSPITMVPVPTLIQTTIPADPALLGAPFALQVIDLLPTNATGALCGPPKYAQKFRVSDTRVTTIR